MKVQLHTKRFHKYLKIDVTTWRLRECIMDIRFKSGYFCRLLFKTNLYDFQTKNDTILKPSRLR